MKTLIIVSLILAMTVTARCEEPFKLLSTKDGGDPSFGLTECMVGIGVLAAGGAVVIWLKHFCEQHFGTNSTTIKTNLPVQRSDNLLQWATVGQASWHGSYYEYRETNSASENQHFYRLVLQP